MVLGTGKIPTKTEGHQKQELPLIVRMSRDKGSHLLLGLGWPHHSGIKKRVSDLWCPKGTQSNISHRRLREITVVSGSKSQTKKGKVTVDQERYIETMLEWFQMDQCKPSRTPPDLNLKLQTAQNGDEEVEQRIYKSLVGSLLYLAKKTRPDIVFTVNILSRHMNALQNQHWMCGKTLLRYLQGSKGLKLTYTKEGSYDLLGESDADWSGDVNDRKSTTGYSFQLNGRGAALSWGVAFLPFPQLLFLH